VPFQNPIFTTGCQETHRTADREVGVTVGRRRYCLKAALLLEMDVAASMNFLGQPELPEKLCATISQPEGTFAGGKVLACSV
jgi:hypothetical protein